MLGVQWHIPTIHSHHLHVGLFAWQNRDCASWRWRKQNWWAAHPWYLHSVSPLPQKDALWDALPNSVLFSWLPTRQKHDFSEETLDLVTEISLNLLDSQSAGKGLRKDQSLSFQLELFHYSWMWHNYKRCCMWSLIRIIQHSSLLAKSPQLLLWSPKCDWSTESKSPCKWPLLRASLRSLGHFGTFHNYQ